MGRIDRQTVESHLTNALQHLATAGVVVRHLDRTDALDPADRIRLLDAAIQVQAMLGRVTDVLDDRTLEKRLATLLRETERRAIPVDEDDADAIIELPDLAQLADEIGGDDSPSPPDSHRDDRDR